MTTQLLAVDDSKTLRKVLEITFAGEDFQTELAASAEEALQKLRAQRPAVAVIDASLGSANGYDLCQQIKSEAPEVAVVLLSSKHRPYDQARGSQVGADDYIDKPFDTQKLIDKVNALCQGATKRAAPAGVAAGTTTARPAPAAPRVAASAAPRPASGGAIPTTPARPGAGTATAGARPVAPAPQFGASPAPRAVASAPTAAATPAEAPAAATPAPASTTAPAQVASAIAAAGVDLNEQLQSLGLDAQQVQGVLALSREVVERVVWEVVPVLAETLIKEEINRLTAE